MRRFHFLSTLRIALICFITTASLHAQRTATQNQRGITTTTDGRVGIGTSTLRTETQVQITTNTHDYGVLTLVRDDQTKAIAVANTGQTDCVPAGADVFRVYGDGRVEAKEIKVATDIWCDYVFEDDYPLRKPEELKAYIDENGHLPGIPAAEEVMANGVEVGEMQTKLLEKVEELTLYMLQQNAELKALKAENESLKQRMKDLESRK
ncbi:MAG: hypothetical protein AAF570_05965 [Bacteroidota bacterium]